MRYIRFVITILVTIFSLSVNGQIQKGFVKTKGRLNSNGAVIAGTRLPGVTVTVKGGNAVVSGNKGTFSIIVPGNNYYLQNVEKTGYVLTDPDVLSKQYAYSKNPLVLVLETPGQQADEKLATERKIRKTLQRQLQAKEDELEALKEQQQISDEAYRQQLQEMYNQQENNEKLISEMAKRYSKMDFDEVDEFNRKISSLILEGRLTEADSLVNTKGDVNSRAATLRQHQEANAQEEQELGKRKKKLEKSMEMTQKELEDLAQDCYSKFEIFKMQHLNDSASFYIDLRAKLDTSNINWQIQAGQFVESYLAQYAKAIEYYQQALNLAIQSKEKDTVSIIYNYIGKCRSNMAEYDFALEYFRKALKIKDSINIKNISYASLLNNFGVLFERKGNYKEALDYHNKALNAKIELLGNNHPEIASTLQNIGIIYSVLTDYPKALDYFQKALSIQQESLDADNPDIAYTYNSIGSVYHHQRLYDKAIDSYMKALSINKKTLPECHPCIAMLFHNIGLTYTKIGQDSLALVNLQKALYINSRVLGPDHPDVASSLNNIGVIYETTGDFPTAIDYYRKALQIREKNLGKEHPSVAISYNNIGMANAKQGNYIIALDNYRKALSICEKSLGKEHTYVATVNGNIGEVYEKTGDYLTALDYFSKALPVFEKTIGSSHPSTQKILKHIEEVKSHIK